jgi:GTP pyrophosphokinase
LVNTNRAKSKIKYWFRKQDRDQNVISGRNLFDRELRRLSIPSKDINYGKLAKDFNYNSPDEFFAAIGVGDLNVGKIVNYLTLPEKEEDEDEEFLAHIRSIESDQKITLGDDSVSVQGLKGILTTLARCCKPAPGDQIVGYITRGRGATIHRSDCPNILRIKDRERLARVSWGEPKSTYPVDVRIKAYDRDGLLRDVSTVIAEEGINMKQVQVDVDKNQATFDLTLEVDNISQLSRVLTILENLPNVMEARRIKPG